MCDGSEYYFFRGGINYNKMKTTEVDVCGFDSFFTVQLKRKDYLTLQEVREYIEKDITDTATIIRVIHKSEDGDEIIKNKSYKPPYIIDTTYAKKHLRK
jgi:hypothetical protein